MNHSVPILAIPISSAFVCCGCELVIMTAQVCPNCASAESIASLSAWLNRRALDDVKLALAVKELDRASAVRARP